MNISYTTIFIMGSLLIYKKYKKYWKNIKNKEIEKSYNNFIIKQKMELTKIKEAPQ